MPRLLAPPPPLLTVDGGATTTTTAVVNQPRIDTTDNYSSDASPSSSSTSIITVVVIVASSIVVSASIYLLLRLISRRFSRSIHAFSVTDDVVSRRHLQNCVHGRQDDGLLESLPLFSFASVAGGGIAGGDCAVCLAKFEPHEQLRLLPLCCHAFHARCIDAWLSSNQTCPLCRSTVRPTEADVMSKILEASNTGDRGNSFRVEIGNISRRREAPDFRDSRRSYSVGSFEYIVDEGYEVSMDSTHRRGTSDGTSVDKESIGAPEPPGDRLAAEINGGRSWLREYIDRMSLSSRATSLRSSGRFFTGSSRRSDTVFPVDDAGSNRIGEEITEMFRWLSGV